MKRMRILKAVGLALAVYVIALAIFAGYYVLALPNGSVGPSPLSSFLSLVMSPGAYPIPVAAGLIAGVISYWKWE